MKLILSAMWHRALLAISAAVCLGFAISAMAQGADSSQNHPLPTMDGYRGIWYMNQPSHDEYKYKYSGGFATYPQQHIPIAYYCKEVNKTFFCFGGTTAQTGSDKQDLL